MRLTPVLFIAMLLLFCVTVFADGTPEALQCIDGVSYVSDADAHSIRGTCSSRPSVSVPDFWQDKSFSVGGTVGFATGSVTLFEGLLASFEYNRLENGPDGITSMATAGNIGGLTGSVGSVGGLSWATQGKSLTETTNFSGDFLQNFSQHFEMPTIVGF